MNTIKVTTDDYDSGYLATQHLIERGCNKIAYLMVSKHLSIGNKRMQGYMQALKDHHLPFNKNWIIYAPNDDRETLKLILKLLKPSNRPDELFASVERLAINSYEACNILSLKIPGDIKIISFSNLQIADFLNPSLSTITQPAFDMGKKAASLLFKLIEKKNTISDEIFVIKSTLVSRNSTAM
jgi:LacI family transcriptional regulator